ncbi:MAG: hypothetical protein GX556_03710 [Fibrobacter sp.]|nr:hypothetical protein [Fibrobacter sp.]
MQLELTLELEIKITDRPININGIIKAVHLYQNELGKSKEGTDCFFIFSEK